MQNQRCQHRTATTGTAGNTGTSIGSIPCRRTDYMAQAPWAHLPPSSFKQRQGPNVQRPIPFPRVVFFLSLPVLVWRQQRACVHLLQFIYLFSTSAASTSTRVLSFALFLSLRLLFSARLSIYIFHSFFWLDKFVSSTRPSGRRRHLSPLSTSTSGLGTLLDLTAQSLLMI